MFRNVRFLQLDAEWPDSEEALDEALRSAEFTPCGPLTEAASGWEAPVELPDASPLARRVAGADLITLRTQSRLLPASAINEALEERVGEYRERMGDAPTPREKRRMKLETRDRLMPKALLRSRRTRAAYLGAERILAIDAATPARAELLVEMLRIPLGRLEARPLVFDRSVGALLQQVFMGDSIPGIRLGRECRMQDPAEIRSSVRWADLELADPSIRKHVRDGMRLTHLGIEFDGALSCVLDEAGNITKLRFLGAEANEVADEEDKLARFDAEFVLLTGMLRRLIETLTKTLGS